ncbi:MAG: NYN domain-containing protein [Chloroflexota bacterium]
MTLKKKTTMVVDVQSRYYESVDHGFRVDNKTEAAMLKMLADAHGRNNRQIAIIAHGDKNGLDAYVEEGFQTIIMNGDRKQALPKLVTSEMNEFKKTPPSRLIIVSADPIFGTLCASANDETDVSIWNPIAEKPAWITEYDHRPLSEIIPNTRVDIAKWHVFIDYENIHISLKNRGLNPNPKEIIDAIKKAKGEGKIVSMIAYADWGMLEGRSSSNLQRILTECGVSTRYQINLRGKNSADMEIVSDIHSAIAGFGSNDAVSIVSQDRDFRAIMETIKHTHKAVLMTLKNGASYQLEQSADEVIYLDEHIKIPKKQIRSLNAHKSPRYSDPNMKIALQIASWMYSMRWQWVFEDKLRRQIEDVGDLTEAHVDAALEDGLLIRLEDRPNAVQLNPNLPTSSLARHLCWWINSRIDHCLEKKGWDYVDSNYLTNSMTYDRKLKDLRVGQTRHNAEHWLALVEAVGIAETCEQPHPKVPGKLITTWWQPGNAPLETDTLQSEDDQIDKEEAAQNNNTSSHQPMQIAQPYLPVVA